MSHSDPTLLSAEVRSRTARAEFRDALGDAKAWLTPARLKAEAAIAATHQIDEAKAAVRRSVNRHPLASWSALALAATLITYLLRRPVAALTRTVASSARSLRKHLHRR